MRMREQRVDRAAERHRPHRLHRVQLVHVSNEVDDVVEVVYLDPREASIGMERRNGYVAVRGEQLHRLQVFRRHRAATQAMRERDDRIARARVGENRKLSRALHVRHRAFTGNRIARTRIVRGRRIADDRSEVDRMTGKCRREHLRVVGHLDRVADGPRRLGEDLGDIADLVVDRIAFPVVGGNAPGRRREVLRDVAARHFVRPECERRKRGQRIGGSRGGRDAQREESKGQDRNDERSGAGQHGH